MINFSRSFETAWTRMVVILFQPFDLGKWFAIGFSAFLAGLIEGGHGVHMPSDPSEQIRKFKEELGKSSTIQIQTNNIDIHGELSKLLTPLAGIQIGLLVILGLLALVIGFAFVALLAWLGARGQFMFVDNVARNRGAIGWPWQAYARQANSFFLLYLVVIVCSFAVILPLIGIAIMMGIPLYQENRWPNSVEMGGFIVLGAIYVICSVIVGAFIFLFREFGVPIMFRQGLTVGPAVQEVWKIATRNFGSVFVLILLRIFFAIVTALISFVLCCVCCISFLPYIGTVFLLPVLVYVKCFTLECLAQFGPQYDVWTIDVPPTPPTEPVIAPVSPLPPL